MKFLNNFGASSFELKNGVCTVDGVIQSSTQPCEEAITGIFGLITAILVPILIIGLVFFVFWVIQFVHVIKHQDIKDRGLWIGVLAGSLLLGLIWAAVIVYYFAVMRPYKKGLARNTSAPIAQTGYPPAPQQNYMTAQPVAGQNPPAQQPPTNNLPPTQPA